MCYTWRPTRAGAVLRCSRYQRGMGCVSNGHSVRRIHAWVLARVKAALSDPEEFLAAQAQDNRDNGRLEDLRLELRDLEQRQANLVHALEVGAFPLPTLVGRQREIEQRQAAIHHEIASLQSAREQHEAWCGLALSLAQVVDQLDTMPEAELREIYKQLIRRVYLRKGEEPALEWLE